MFLCKRSRQAVSTRSLRLDSMSRTILSFRNFLPQRLAPSLLEWLASRYGKIEGKDSSNTVNVMCEVSVFITCLVDQLCPSVGVSMVEVFRRAGCGVGFDLARHVAVSRRSTPVTRESRICQAIHRNIRGSDSDAIVSPSGSCAAMVQHFHELFPGDKEWRERAERSPREPTNSGRS